MNKKPLMVLHSLDYRILYARNRDIKILQDFNDMLDSNLSLIFYGSHEKIFCKSTIKEGENYCLPIGKIIYKDDNSSRIDIIQDINGKSKLKSIVIQSFLRDKHPGIANKLSDKLYDLAVRVNKYE